MSFFFTATGFELFGVGLSYGQTFVVLSNIGAPTKRMARDFWRHVALYEIREMGGETGVLMATLANSADRGGSWVPTMDQSGRYLPADWSNLYVSLSIDSSVAVCALKPVTLRLQSLHGQQPVLYEHTFNMRVTVSGATSKISLRGRARKLTPGSGRYSERVDAILGFDD